MPPEAPSPVSFRQIGGTLYATLNVAAVSSMEVARVREALWKRIDETPRGTLRHFVVDLESVSFLNSEGISMLVATHTAAKQHGAKVVVANVNPTMMETFAAVRMDSVLTVCSTPAELDRALQ